MPASKALYRRPCSTPMGVLDGIMETACAISFHCFFTRCQGTASFLLLRPRTAAHGAYSCLGEERFQRSCSSECQDAAHVCARSSSRVYAAVYVKVQPMEARGRKREEAGRRKRGKHGQALYTLTPDRPPLAANTGNNILRSRARVCLHTVCPITT